MNDEPSYTPAPDELQLTFRAVAAGCVLGAMVCAMNIYFGLKTGWSIGGSLIAAILSFALFSAVRSAFPAVPRFSTLETNIAQTAGSAAGSMTCLRNPAKLPGPALPASTSVVVPAWRA